MAGEDMMHLSGMQRRDIRTSAKTSLQLARKYGVPQRLINTIRGYDLPKRGA